MLLIAEGINSEDRLLEDLIGNGSNYNKLVRPVFQESDTVTVNLGLDLIEFVELVSNVFKVGPRECCKPNTGLEGRYVSDEELSEKL